MKYLWHIALIVVYISQPFSSLFADMPSETERKAFETYLNKICLDETCMQQASLYAKFLGEGSKVMTNGKHAFVVKDNKIYDSTNSQCSGSYCSTKYAKKYYGSPSRWKELKI